MLTAIAVTEDPKVKPSTMDNIKVFQSEDKVETTFTQEKKAANIQQQEEVAPLMPDRY